MTRALPSLERWIAGTILAIASLPAAAFAWLGYNVAYGSIVGGDGGALFSLVFVTCPLAFVVAGWTALLSGRPRLALALSILTAALLAYFIAGEFAANATV